MDNIKITVNREIEIDTTESLNNDHVLRSENTPPKNSFLDRIVFVILMISAFLMPLFFLPIFSIPVEFSKSVLLSVSVLVALILWLVARLKDGTLVIPKTSFLIFYALIPLIFLIASLFSPAIQVSLMGVGSEVGTFFSILVMFIMTFLASILFQSEKRILNLYMALILSMLIVALFQVIRLIGGADVLSFGLFTNPLSNLVGKWNDLAIFFGFTTVLSLLTIEFLNVRKILKTLLYVALVVSIVFMLLVNFTVAWIIVGLFALVVFVYSLSFNSQKEEGPRQKRISIPSLVVVVLSVALIFLGGFVGNFLSSQFGISQIEARPTWEATFDIAKNTLSEDPVLGAGPNKFASQWLLHKPDSVNESIFWNADFNFGIGVVPSFAVTTGLLGFLAWIAFLAFFVFWGIRAILSVRSDKRSHYLVVSSFLSALYLWIFSIFYIPNVAVFSMAFLMTGVFVASLVHLGMIKNFKLSFSRDPKQSFVSVLVLILFILVSVVGLYASVQKFTSAASFQASRFAISEGNLDTSKANMERAVRFGGSDLYYRSLADIHLAELGLLISQNASSLEDIQAEFQNSLGNAINNARLATEKDPENYQNWISLARVYESVVPLQIEGAYENAKETYVRALELNPKSPSLYLSLARLELAKGNRDLAKEDISAAINLKNNYTDAIFLSARISADEGDTDEAIEKTETASLISPNDVGLFFNLGFLKYSDNDFEGAIVALERAVLLRPDYANAKYFLGLSYERVGRDDEAIDQFKGVLATNPDNEEVESILENLEAGRRPFADINVVSPEERDEPPIGEDI